MTQDYIFAFMCNKQGRHWTCYAARFRLEGGDGGAGETGGDPSRITCYRVCWLVIYTSDTAVSATRYRDTAQPGRG